MKLFPRWVLTLAFFACSRGLTADVPKADAAKIFAELKVYDAQGRPWRAAREDWDGARQRVSSDPAWAAWLQKERAAVDAWSATHHDHVEWVAGWSHDGVSPKDGSRVNWTDKIPGEEVQFFSSPSDPKIEITPKLRAWWVVSFRDKHVDFMVRAARLYRLTGEKAYAAWAAGQMDFYSDNYLKWAPTAQGARLFWQTLTEASNLVNYTEVVRLLGDFTDAERREKWRKEFFLPEVEVLNKNHQDIHNIATWQRCAVAQVALLFGDEAMWHNALESTFGVRHQIADGITGDFLWREQSLGYNNFVVSAVQTLFTAAGIYGRADELASEMTAAENLMLSPLYLRFPNGQLPNPADNAGIPRAPNREIFANTYRIFPTTIGLAECATRRDWNTLVDPPAAPPRAVELPAVSSHSFESTRMAVLKSGAWQVFFHYGQLGKSHSQAEALNFSAFYGDTDITHDPGVVGYGSPLYKEYYTRGLNHNVPLINGEGEEPPQLGELFVFSATPARVAAAQPHYREHTAARRTLEIKDDALIDTAVIESDASTPQPLGLALHLQGKVRLPETFADDATFADGRPVAFSYWKNVSAATYRDRAEFDVVYGDGKLELHVTLTAPGEFKLWHGSSPDVPPRRRESFYLELVAPAKSATFTTTFAPAGKI